MDEDKEQKQHAPTGKRLAELSEKGQTLRSKDLSGGLLLFFATLLLIFMGPRFKDYFVMNFKLVFSHLNEIALSEHYLFVIFKQMVLGSVSVLLPFFIIMYFIPFISVFILGGWNFSIKALRFKWETLDLFSNLSNLFGKRIIVDMVKSLLKLGIIASIFIYFIMYNNTIIFRLAETTIHYSMVTLYDMIQRFITTLLMGVIMISSIDALYSFFEYHQRIKMTLQEIKDEAKQAEGSPEVKRKMRSMMMTILKQKIKNMVPTADVIITNPTHFAVALKYREGVDRAPRVIAKGKGPLALYIRGLAASKGIPIYEAPPLARAIYHTTKLGGEVSPALYVAVALVLSYINQLRYYQSGKGPMPVKASDLEIPADYIFDR